MIGKDIISIDQFDKKDIDIICNAAGDLEKLVKKEGCLNILRCKTLASLFFEPSTRTKLSFDSAMHKMGGEVISTTGVTFSSIAKGESLPDTIKTIERYADIIAIRHPEVGSAQIAADSADIPVINAGDGPGEHPTQALLDFYTIKKEKGNTHGLKIAMVGDLKNGRTIHSLIKLLVKYDGVEFCLVAPKELRLPEDYLNLLRRSKVKFHETECLEDTIRDCDVFYMTRIQKERFKTEKDYEKHKGCFVLDNKLLRLAKKDMIIMHPLPRVGEIKTEVDSDPRAKYFDQVENGLYIRMALLGLVLGKV